MGTYSQKDFLVGAMHFCAHKCTTLYYVVLYRFSHWICECATPTSSTPMGPPNSADSAVSSSSSSSHSTVTRKTRPLTAPTFAVRDPNGGDGGTATTPRTRTEDRVFRRNLRCPPDAQETVDEVEKSESEKRRGEDFWAPEIEECQSD